MAAWMRADSSAMRSPSRFRSGGASGAGGAAPSATAGVVVSLAPGASSAVVAAVAAGLVVAGAGHAGGVGGRGSVLVSGAMPPWYTRNSVPPWRPVDEPMVRFGLCGPNSDAAGRERALRAETRAEQAGSGTWPDHAPKTVSTPAGPSRAIFSTFSGAWPTANPSLSVRSRKSWHEKPRIRCGSPESMGRRRDAWDSPAPAPTRRAAPIRTGARWTPRPRPCLCGAWKLRQ